MLQCVLLVIITTVVIKFCFRKYFRATLNFPVWNVCYLARRYVPVYMYTVCISNVNITNMLAFCIFLLVALRLKFCEFTNLQTHTDLPVMPNACL